jgi:hypothetical protein
MVHLYNRIVWVDNIGEKIFDMKGGKGRGLLLGG